jgi:hypothetical protein
MANKHKGEVDFKADANARHREREVDFKANVKAREVEREVEFTSGKKVYTLAFSINAMCELETALGGNVVELANAMSDPSRVSIRTLRTLFWAGLRDHHELMSELEAGKLMNDIGMVESGDLIFAAFRLAFPEVEPANPLPLTVPKPAASTGKAH